jgi:hypothetical protein
MGTINRLVRKSTPTLLEESKGNEVIDAINSLQDSEGSKGIDVTLDNEGRLQIKIKDTIEVVLCRNGQPITRRIALVSGE